MPDKLLSQGSHSFTTAAGATLTYFVRGGGPRTLVNVAPGWGCASVLYQNSFRFLEDVFTFVHLETRGTRGSSFPADLSQMSSWHMSEDIDALRAHLGLEALDSLMGHSNGGSIATWYAIRFPTRVRKLVLVDTQAFGQQAQEVAGPATEAILAARPERDCVAAYSPYDPAAMTTDEAFGAALDAILPLYFAYPDKYLAYFKNEVFTNVPQAKCVQNQWPAEDQHRDQVEQLGGIRAETLVVVGREDFICPVPASELIVGRIPNAKLEIVEGSGHFPWIEQETSFESIMKDYSIQKPLWG
ncbi:alpha/beta-hydrolase [Auricularia subglabra TFB-10046 SS5]|uniref:Alpha/beta-hydrolase n=1 Tax=Auricularia subglabra (strain TFB-10046 / SS5) TaxID=717982 RepID=J0D2V6_AURST|nr:alpha/beta-hydrolase [Auricularia subglabra TFB-10046 SS5]